MNIEYFNLKFMVLFLSPNWFWLFEKIRNIYNQGDLTLCAITLPAFWTLMGKWHRRARHRLFLSPFFSTLSTNKQLLSTAFIIKNFFRHASFLQYRVSPIIPKNVLIKMFAHTTSKTIDQVGQGKRSPSKTTTKNKGTILNWLLPILIDSDCASCDPKEFSFSTRLAQDFLKATQPNISSGNT